jgi:hypothetical protein
VKACFTHNDAPPLIREKPHLIDHRFFFQREDGTGGHSCGIVRKAVGDQLFRGEQYFADASFLKILPKFIDVRPTVGYFMESAVLFYLQLKGIPCHTYLGNSMKVINFDTSIPNFEKNIIGKPVLYRPTKYNFETLDGIIVFIKEQEGQNQKKQLFLYPYQVTLQRKGHKNSHDLFFEKYEQWVEDLQEFDVETEFLWFTGDPSSYIVHPVSGPLPQGKTLRSGFVCNSSQWPAHEEKVISFNDLSKELGQKYEDAASLMCLKVRTHV